MILEHLLESIQGAFKIDAVGSVDVFWILVDFLSEDRLKDEEVVVLFTSAPPAPRPLMAAHSPGAMKAQTDTTERLKKVVLYHVRLYGSLY